MTKITITLKKMKHGVTLTITILIGIAIMITVILMIKYISNTDSNMKNHFKNFTFQFPLHSIFECL